MDKSVEEKLESIEKGIAEILTRQEESAEDSFTIKTSSLRKAHLFVNIENLMNALIEIKSWRRSLYKGYDNKIVNMTAGTEYCNGDLEKPIDFQEKYDMQSVSVVTVEDILKKIDEVFDEYGVWSLTEDY